MEGPRYIWWNFVSSRPERIAAAKEEGRAAASTPCSGDEEEFIPLARQAGRRRSAPREACTTPERARRVPAIRTLQGGLNMSRAIPGLHHVTAISGPPQANVDFYVGTMRQRLSGPSTSTPRTPTTCTTATGRARPAPSYLLPVRRRGAGTRRTPAWPARWRYCASGGLDAWMVRWPRTRSISRALPTGSASA